MVSMFNLTIIIINKAINALSVYDNACNNMRAFTYYNQINQHQIPAYKEGPITA